METPKFNDIKKEWFKIAKYANSDGFTYELDIHKKLSDIFSVGNFYYYVFNCATAQIEMASDTIKDILGIAATTDFTTDYILSIIHPQDLSYFFDCEAKVTAFFGQLPIDKIFKYKVSYDYRARRKDGRYIRLLQQVVTIQSDENGAILRTLGVHTDITHLKKEHNPSLSFIGLDGEPSFYNVYNQQSKSCFTKTEKVILDKLIEGKSNHEIADELYISKHTVDTHRRNMIRKANAQSITELILKYLKGNLIVSFVLSFLGQIDFVF